MSTVEGSAPVPPEEPRATTGAVTVVTTRAPPAYGESKGELGTPPPVPEARRPPKEDEASPGIMPLPYLFDEATAAEVSGLIADMMESLIRFNDTLDPPGRTGVTRFHSRTPPAITVPAYFARFRKYVTLDTPILISFLIYVDRFCTKHPHFALSSLTVHRFICACVVVGCKTWCDVYCTNGHYGRVGGIGLQEINALELELLFGLDWQVLTSAEELQRYYTSLVESNPRYIFDPRTLPPKMEEDTLSRARKRRDPPV